MLEATVEDVQQNFQHYREIAEGANGPAQAILVLHNGRQSVVILSAQEYARLIQQDRISSRLEDTPG